MMQAYPDQAGSKREGTSQLAARKLGPRTRALHAAIHRLLARSSPLTADEIADQLDLPVLYIRPRVSELVKQGRVIDSGKRGRNASGMAAAKWTAR